jgi:hypothetical protein
VDVVVDSVSKGAVTSWGFTDVQAVHTVTASFEADSVLTFTITPFSYDHYLILSPNTPQTVNSGGTVTFNFTFDEAYYYHYDMVWYEVYTDDVYVYSGYTMAGFYTFTNVQANYTVYFYSMI